MSDVAISAEKIGKRYHIGEHLQFKSLRDSIASAVSSPIRALANWARQPLANADTVSANGDFWALKDVSFEIKHGETMGIIGRNGAGKSTILKILARITAPTEGRAQVHGRVGSLLEVGTAFHGELTGRENIFLNGAILGMRRNEIARKFDEIVAFADIDKFIDTPVKHYSSGMFMRLAFAVAAHLEPEILLVDEVLAVGDIEFQKKCLGKMGEIANQGRTVLFVTHNMVSLANLCPRSILLEGGHKIQDGPTKDVIGSYLAMQKSYQGERIWNDLQSAPGNDRLRLHAVRIFSASAVSGDVEIDKDIEIQIDFWNLKPGANASVCIHLLDKMGVIVLSSMNTPSVNLITDEWSGAPYPVGFYRTVCTIPGNFLNEGLYSLKVLLATNVIHLDAVVTDVVSFNVLDNGAMRREYSGIWYGVVRPKLAWRTTCLKSGE